MGEGQGWLTVFPEIWLIYIIDVHTVYINILILIVCKMCFDSKVVDNRKRLSYQLTSSKVNAFLNAFLRRVDLCCTVDVRKPNVRFG